MIFFHRASFYEKWAPFLARVLFGLMFLMGASMKIPGTEGFMMEVQMAAGAGVPLAMIAVFLAFLLEVGGGLALVLGWHARIAAFLLAPFTLILALFFYRDFSDPMIMSQFIMHIGLAAGLLYVSVYGAEHVALRKDAHV